MFSIDRVCGWSFFSFRKDGMLSRTPINLTIRHLLNFLWQFLGFSMIDIPFSITTPMTNSILYHRSIKAYPFCLRVDTIIITLENRSLFTFIFLGVMSLWVMLFIIFLPLDFIRTEDCMIYNKLYLFICIN